MKAKDVMTTEVVYADPETSVRAIAQTLLKRRISAVPVIDDGGRVIGIVSEGDLMRRPESETDRPRSWWLKLLETPEDRASQYLKSHGLTARDVMTREPITVTEDTPLEEIAIVLERRAIKRVPVLRNGKLVGIVTRADLLHGLVARAGQAVKPVPLHRQRAKQSSPRSGTRAYRSTMSMSSSPTTQYISGAGSIRPSSAMRSPSQPSARPA